MKNKYILAGCFALFLKSKSVAQDTDSTFKNRTIPKTEIEAIFSNYNQNGDNSAVTGGIGTEQLKVYTNTLKIKRNFNYYKSASFVGGTDIISSASTDKIDDAVSSASLVDTRTFANLYYQRKFKKQDIAIRGGTGFSLESDYLSFPVSLSIEHTSPINNRTISLNLQGFFDDLRWGRVSPHYYRPYDLVYPKELRNTKWFDEYRRTTLGAKFAFTQAINKRIVAGIFPELIYQKGLLSTPFHRVYFTDNSLKVENLPQERWKVPFGIKVNYFSTSKMILKTGYSYYRDNFQIKAHAIEFESALKIKPLLVLSPFVRFYKQTGTPYFHTYKTHNPDEEFYTSDYDLSSFSSFKVGLGLSYRPNNFLNKKLYFNQLNLRYAYYKRSNSLQAHIVTVYFKFDAY